MERQQYCSSSRAILLLLVGLLLQEEHFIVTASNPNLKLNNHKASSVASPLSKSPSTYGNDLKDWIQARCGGSSGSSGNTPNNVALWVYEGALFDPLEGRKIANVEGLELVQCAASSDDHQLQTTTATTTNNKSGRGVWGDLEVGPLLNDSNATYDHASTLLSRKLFCYQSPDDPKKLLSSIRLRLNAPLRKIPTSQAVAVYDTATTYIARGPELMAHTEWPDRQSIWGRATRNFIQTNKNNSQKTTGGNDYDDAKKAFNNDRQDSSNGNNSKKSFDFTIYARKKSASKTPEQLFDLTKPPLAQAANNDPSVVVAPPRAKLIEFGAGSSQGKDKFGARESYSYTYDAPQATLSKGILQRLGLRRPDATVNIATATNNMNCQVRYSRYGEGPPFFGPGRVCSLELQGRRVTSLDDLPPLTASVIAKRMSPLFLSPPPTLDRSSTTTNHPQDDQGKHNNVLHVRLSDDEKEEFWLPDYLKERGQQAWSRLRGTSGGRK